MNSLTTQKDSMLRTYGDLINIADMLVKSRMLPNGITTKEAAAAIILKGRELGIPTMEAFSLINVIQGKPTISPQGMIALARRTKELEDISITDDNDTAVVIVKRKGQSPFKTTFSARDAATMGLANKDNWTKQPRIMRQWRAISANFRITFPDVIGGMYTPEELGAEIDDEGAFIPNEANVVDAVPVEQAAALSPELAAEHAHALGVPMAEIPNPAPKPVVNPNKPTFTEPPAKPKRQAPPMSPVQHNKTQELWRLINGAATDDQVAQGLDKMCVEMFQHGIVDATYEEGAKLTGRLLTELRSRQPA